MSHRTRKKQTKALDAGGPHWPRRSRRLIPAADAKGRPIYLPIIRHGGKAIYGATIPCPLAEPPAEPLERSRLPALRRRVSAELARYRASGLFSTKELRTIEALWIEGLSLREHARREGVTPQAIEVRIHAMRQRAVRFWHWWRLKNQMRARRSY